MSSCTISGNCDVHCPLCGYEMDGTEGDPCTPQQGDMVDVCPDHDEEYAPE